MLVVELEKRCLNAIVPLVPQLKSTRDPHDLLVPSDRPDERTCAYPQGRRN